MSRDKDDSTDRVPAAFLSHGAQTLADDARWTSELAAWASGLPQLSSVLVVSAHWKAAPLGTVADDSLHIETAIEGFWHGLSKRSVQMT